MLHNYFKTTLRNLFRNAANTGINVFGLSLGITCSLVIFLLVNFLLSHDRHHQNFDRIYRIVNSSFDQQGIIKYGNGVQAPMPDAIREELTGIEDLTFISNKYRNTLVAIEKGQDEYQYFEEEEGVAYTEPSYFHIFSRDIVSGSAEELSQPGKVVISEKLAAKYFGEENPLGKELIIDKDTPYQVAAVMADLDKRSDFPFEMFLSYATIKPEYIARGWESVSSDDQIYLLLDQSKRVADFDKGLAAFVKKQFPGDTQEFKYFLQPLSELHFDTRFSNYRYATVSRGDIWAMILLGAFILLTACINFINISTAVAVKRGREIGVRKVLGGTEAQLRLQFLGETFMIVLFSVVMSLGFAELLLLYINPLLEVNIGINWFADGKIEVFLLLMLLIVTLLAGLYPSQVMASQRPAVIIKQQFSGARSAGFSLRKMLVAFQFVITPFFIIGTLVLISQVNFLKNSDLGFVSEAIVVVNIPDSPPTRKKMLKAGVDAISGVKQATLASSTPLSGSISVSDIQLDGDDNMYFTDIKLGDEDYTDLFDIKILAGQGLLATDTISGMLVNEEFLKVTGIESAHDALGRMVKIWGVHVPVRGVVRNFHSRNMKMKLEPLVIVNGIKNSGVLSVKLGGKNLNQQLGSFESVWKEVYPEYTFEYEFMDQAIADMYKSEESMATIFTFFSIVAIFIGCLGLFGLVSFTTNQKVKEIGIRKALGASVKNILVLVSKDFMIPVIVGFVIAAPLGAYFMGLWLNNFEYKISLSVEIFVVALLATIVIAIIATAFKTVHAAKANPVDSLRND